MAFVEKYLVPTLYSVCNMEQAVSHHQVFRVYTLTKVKRNPLPFLPCLWVARLTTFVVRASRLRSSVGGRSISTLPRCLFYFLCCHSLLIKRKVMYEATQAVALAQFYTTAGRLIYAFFYTVLSVLYTRTSQRRWEKVNAASVFLRYPAEPRNLPTTPVPSVTLYAV